MSVPVVDSSCGCNRCTSRTAEMYDLPGRCINCGARFTVRSRKGDKAPLSVTCPACEVNGYSWRAKPMSTDEQRRPSTLAGQELLHDLNFDPHQRQRLKGAILSIEAEVGAELSAKAERADRLEAALRRLVAVIDVAHVVWTDPVPEDSITAIHDAKEVLAERSGRAGLGEAEVSEETGR